ncbi:hypothetical protein GCM10010912_38040 [Paenibacillus albidus]|uniref:Uncharacterized protein n=1 Tax=Paenibacillus albidus TaxID=2041023 RepID=A0A917FKI4_9BACL|nr:hypothetical protein [Paenibacillus albidus]GGF89306.1 hypothetical protein GCM10010912_38040 [Paenibacillus albidus]
MKNIKGVIHLSGAVRRAAGGHGGGSNEDRSRSKRKAGTSHPAQPSGAKVYTAPSLEGGDEEYKKLISGKVDNNKPSFA